MWYADDATAGGQLASLLYWWKHLLAYEPMYGYFPNATKTCLIVESDQLNFAQILFNGTNIQISCDTWVLLLELDHLQKAMSLTK